MRKLIVLFLFSLLYLAGCQAGASLTATQPSPAVEETTPTPTPVSEVVSNPVKQILPAITQTLAPSSPESQIVTSVPASETPPADSAERIYAWLPPSYGYLEADTCCQDFITTLPGSPGGMDLTTIQPRYALQTVSFAPGEDKLAIVHTLNPDTSVIVTNLQMDERFFEWSDAAGLMADLTSKYHRVRLSWGPGNHFLVFEIWDDSAGKVSQQGLISFQENKAYALAGHCGHLQLDGDWNPALTCPLKEQSGAFITLNYDGTTEIIASLPDGSLPVQRWAYSAQAGRLVWADKDGLLRMISRDQPARSLQFMLAEGRNDVDLDVLQFSKDGSKLLIFVASDERDPCIAAQACWVVFDVENSTLLWASGAGTAWPATFSPDGSRVVYLMAGYDEAGLFQTFGMVFDLNDHREHLISTIIPAAIRWQE